MERQLTLLEDRDGNWKLDDTTRAVGLEGVARARAALREARAAAREDRTAA
jgi:hypothetical protein